MTSSRGRQYDAAGVLEATHGGVDDALGGGGAGSGEGVEPSRRGVVLLQEQDAQLVWLSRVPARGVVAEDHRRVVGNADATGSMGGVNGDLLASAGAVPVEGGWVVRG